MIEYGENCIGKDCRIFEPVYLGFPSRKHIDKCYDNYELTYEFEGMTLGDRSILRPNTTIYCDTKIGSDFQGGHDILIREHTTIGNGVSVGSHTVIDGYTTIGNKTSIQSMVYIPMHTTIADNVFIGPRATLTNDKYPPTGKPKLVGPILESYCAIGANATILPFVKIGYGSVVAAGAIVTKNVPPNSLAVGCPARVEELPEIYGR